MTKPIVFVSGVDGFIGSSIKRALQYKGYEVYGSVFMRKPMENEFFLDISDADSYSRLPRMHFDAVINNIGIVDQTCSRKLMFAVNAEGVKRMLLWAEGIKCPHFIQISSIGVYGVKAMGQQRDEATARTRFFGVPYQTSKAKGERYIERSPLPYTILRLPSVIGKGDTVITPAIGEYLRDGSFFTCGNQDPLFSILPVRNLADMLDRVVMHGLSRKPTNTIYNAASHHLRWSELVQEYANQLGVDVPLNKRRLISMLYNMHDKLYLFLLTNSRFGAHFPSDKFGNAFDYSPHYSLREAVIEAVKPLLESYKQG